MQIRFVMKFPDSNHLSINNIKTIDRVLINHHLVDGWRIPILIDKHACVKMNNDTFYHWKCRESSRNLVGHVEWRHMVKTVIMIIRDSGI